MKTFLLCLGVCWLSCLIATAQPPPVIEWQKSLGGSNEEEGYATCQTSDGGYIVAGYTKSNDGDVSGSHGNADCWIVKLNSMGNLEWQKCLGGSSFERAYSIQQTSDGGYIVAGITLSNDGDVSGNHGDYDFWVVKITSTGSLVWQKCLGGTGEDWARSVQQTNDGGYIVAGFTHSNDGDVSGKHGVFDYWVVKLTSTGTLVWQKCLGGSYYDMAYAIQQATDGGYIVAGFSRSNDGDVTGNHGLDDLWVVKLTSTGSLEWQKCLGGTNYDVALSIHQTTDAGFIVAGITESNDGNVSGHHGQKDYWVVKMNNTGDLEWQKCLGGSAADFGQSIQQTTDDGYVVTGYTSSNDGNVSGNHGGFDYWVVKLNNTGTLEWQKCLGGSNSELAYSFQQTTDGGYIVSGSSYSNDGDVSGNHGQTDYWVAKLEEEVLAIVLVDISARNEGSRNLIHWETAKEDVGDSFVLERSPDGINFQTIASFKANGNPSIYTFHDELPLQGVNYYRLRMNNIDGHIHYSKLATALMSDSSFSMTAYPNPAKERVTISVTGPVVDRAQLYLSDMIGKTIKVLPINGNTTDIELQGFTKGVYLLRYHDGFYNQVIRLQIN